MWSFCRWTKKIYLPKRRAFNIIVCGLILIFAASIFLGKFLPENDYQLLILRFSNYWIGFLIYLIFFILTADLFLLFLKLASRHLKSSKHLLSSVFLRTILGFLVILLSISFTVYGCFHAKMLTTAHYKATIQKSAGNLTDLRMILLGDFHLGYSVGCSQIEDMVNTINSENADIVVIAGDIFDNNFDALDNPERLEMLLSQINSTYGTYAVFGNHDVTETLIAGFPISSKNAPRDPRMYEFLEKSNISVLEDETAIIDNSFYKKTYVQNQILGRALLESVLFYDKKCIFSSVTRDEMNFYGVTGKELGGIIEQLRLTEGVEVAIFLYETGDDEYKVSLRSKKEIDVSAIAVAFGGGGHVRAAGFLAKGTVHDIINRIGEMIEEQYSDMQN